MGGRGGRHEVHVCGIANDSLIQRLVTRKVAVAIGSQAFHLLLATRETGNN